MQIGIGKDYGLLCLRVHVRVCMCVRVYLCVCPYVCEGFGLLVFNPTLRCCLSTSPYYFTLYATMKLIKIDVTAHQLQLF
jgi:hypothetical protein